MDDRELNNLLRAWKAPEAPAHLRPPSKPEPWWRWLMTGSIRVPVPVGVAAALIAALWLYSTRANTPREQPSASSQPVVSLADFTPVEQVEVRIVGELK